MSAAPVPLRDGLDPTRVRLPDVVTEPTVLAHLQARFPRDAERLAQKMADRDVYDAGGRAMDPSAAPVPRSDIYLYRDPPVEPVVPFPIEIVHRDENLLVIDKPHFLATTPRGAYIARSALVLLRRQFDLPELSPAHRLDRPTAGIVVFTVRTEVRRAYQELFAQRAIEKRYDAIAPLSPHLRLPLRVQSRIIKERGVLQAREVPGEPNADTTIELSTTRGGYGLYRLTPHTGKTHQLRIHMTSSGIPIVGDSLYPTFRDVAGDDYSDPLQLLARSVDFTDPLSGQRRRFASARHLSFPDSSRD